MIGLRLNVAQYNFEVLSQIQQVEPMIYLIMKIAIDPGWINAGLCRIGGYNVYKHYDIGLSYFYISESLINNGPLALSLEN